MFEQRMEQGKQIEKEYQIPNVENIASWNDSMLQNEYTTIEAERLRLIDLMKQKDGMESARLFGQVKVLAATSRAMFFEIERRKSQPKEN